MRKGMFGYRLQSSYPESGTVLSKGCGTKLYIEYGGQIHAGKWKLMILCMTFFIESTALYRPLLLLYKIWISGCLIGFNGSEDVFCFHSVI